MITLFLSMAILFLCQTALAFPLFNARFDFAAGEGPYSVAIGDLDGNGNLDLAVANSWSNTMSVLINLLDKVETYCPKGWSMISLPVDPIKKRLDKLFPGAVVVYGYEKGIGYVRVESDANLEVGKGYWMLLDEEKTYTLTGHPIPLYNRPVASGGWAMIGGCSSSAQVSSNHCDVGVIYRYVQGAGYQRVTSHLEPGQGYWILLNDVDGGATISVKTVD